VDTATGEVWELKGAAWIARGLFHEALHSYEEAVRAGNARAATGVRFCRQMLDEGGDDAVLKGWRERWMARVRDENPDEREIDCYLRSACAGDAVAQFLLGNCFKQGVGIPKDPEQAVVWFHKSAAQGYARAQYHLGRCLYSGEGVPQDVTQATGWFREAAEQGHINAQGILGLCYEAGEGVPKDMAEAAKWLRKYESHPAADQALHSENSTTRRSWEPGDLAVVNPWLQEAAERGDVEVQYHLASCCASGEGMPRNHVQAAYWFHLAAEQGHPGAQYAVAHFYLEGEVLPQNPAMAVRWIRLADAQYEDLPPAPASTASATGSLLKEGGLYCSRERDEQGSYSVMKILKLEYGIAHVRMYSNRYPAIPVSLDESTLYLASIHAGPDERIGIGHTPVLEESVTFANAVLIQQSTVQDEELDGYRMWLEAMP
jgi:TPR repeat protein